MRFLTTGGCLKVLWRFFRSLLYYFLEFLIVWIFWSLIDFSSWYFLGHVMGFWMAWSTCDSDIMGVMVVFYMLLGVVFCVWHCTCNVHTLDIDMTWREIIYIIYLMLDKIVKSCTQLLVRKTNINPDTSLAQEESPYTGGVCSHIWS